uniref:Uncharacterized protein n=1 Tax=Myoviridae sp. ctCo31 TaxID=2825053 RepID=A0A8S5UMT7_9CAUD|nr:MAG TPA: hypothetical protein [Myoviridae sp. ctCo31]
MKKFCIRRWELANNFLLFSSLKINFIIWD